MGKQSSPSPEELEFIFECFTRGLSDREVLEEMQDTEFPIRNPRSIRDRRKAFNAARNVLEITLKQQADPALAKAREEHLAVIHNLIEGWKDALKTPRIDEISLQTTHPTRSIEANLLFECLKQHLPYQTLWKDYSNWVDRFDDYLSSSKSLIKKLSEDPNVMRVLGQVTVKANIKASDFLKKILWPLAEWSRLDKEGASLDSMRRIFIYFLLDDTGDDIDQMVYLEKVLFEEYWHSELGIHLVNLFDELRTLEIRTHKSLDEILIKHDYTWHTCRLCPGQTK